MKDKACVDDTCKPEVQAYLSEARKGKEHELLQEKGRPLTAERTCCTLEVGTGLSTQQTAPALAPLTVVETQELDPRRRSPRSQSRTRK